MEINSREIIKISQLPLTIALGAARIAVEQVVGNDRGRINAGSVVEARLQTEAALEEDLERRFPSAAGIRTPMQDVVIDLTGSEPVISAEVLPEHQTYIEQ